LSEPERKKIKEAVIRDLDESCLRLRAILEDDVKKKLKELIELEIELYSFLLGLKHEKMLKETVQYGEKASKLKIDWSDVAKEILRKINSLVFKFLIPSPAP